MLEYTVHGTRCSHLLCLLCTSCVARAFAFRAQRTSVGNGNPHLLVSTASVDCHVLERYHFSFAVHLTANASLYENDSVQCYWQA